MTQVSNYLTDDPRHPNNFNTAYLLSLYRRLQLQKICAVNRIQYDPSTDTGDTLRDKLVASGAKIPMPHEYEEFTKKIVLAEGVVKENKPQEEPAETEENGNIDIPTNYGQLKKLAREMGMDVNAKTKKQEIMDFINGKDTA